jgi:hypothetical protein
MNMKWTPKEIAAYNDAKEYIDTVIIPLVPVSVKQNMNQSASMYSFVSMLTAAIEVQFKGRLMLMPPLTYLSSMTMDDKLKLAEDWQEEAEEFIHKIFITSDGEWKSRENEIPGSLIWIPSISLEHLDDGQAHAMIMDQVRQLVDIFTAMWSKHD